MAQPHEDADGTSEEDAMSDYEVEYSIKSLSGTWKDERAASYEVSVQNDTVTIRTRRPRGEIIVKTGVSDIKSGQDCSNLTPHESGGLSAPLI